MSALVQTEIAQATVTARAEALEQFLGDPGDAGKLFSFKRAVELDERDEDPAEACAVLA